MRRRDLRALVELSVGWRARGGWAEKGTGTFSEGAVSSHVNRTPDQGQASSPSVSGAF